MYAYLVLVHCTMVPGTIVPGTDDQLSATVVLEVRQYSTRSKYNNCTFVLGAQLCEYTIYGTCTGTGLSVSHNMDKQHCVRNGVGPIICLFFKRGHSYTGNQSGTVLEGDKQFV